jgi:hypothetical protein
MFSCHDPPLPKVRGVKEMDTVGCSVVYLQAEGQIKIAVVEGSIPADADLVPTHQPLQCFLVERFPEEVHVIFSLVMLDKFFPEAPKGHVSYGQEIGESDPKTVMQFLPIVFLECELRRWQEWPSRIIYEVEDQG